MSRYTQQDQYTVGGLNAENESIEQAIADTLSRKGDTPNAMKADIDFNGYQALNLRTPASSKEAATKAYVDSKTKQLVVGDTSLSIGTPADFGAVGDGVTDDSSAIADAFSNLDIVIFDQTYATASPITASKYFDCINDASIKWVGGDSQTVFTINTTEFGNLTVDGGNADVRCVESVTGIDLVGKSIHIKNIKGKVTNTLFSGCSLKSDNMYIETITATDCVNDGATNESVPQAIFVEGNLYADKIHTLRCATGLLPDGGSKATNVYLNYYLAEDLSDNGLYIFDDARLYAKTFVYRRNGIDKPTNEAVVVVRAYIDIETLIMEGRINGCLRPQSAKGIRVGQLIGRTDKEYDTLALKAQNVPRTVYSHRNSNVDTQDVRIDSIIGDWDVAIFNASTAGGTTDYIQVNDADVSLYYRDSLPFNKSSWFKLEGVKQFNIRDVKIKIIDVEDALTNDPADAFFDVVGGSLERESLLENMDVVFYDSTLNIKDVQYRGRPQTTDGLLTIRGAEWQTNIGPFRRNLGYNGGERDSFRNATLPQGGYWFKGQSFSVADLSTVAGNAKNVSKVRVVDSGTPGTTAGFERIGGYLFGSSSPVGSVTPDGEGQHYVDETTSTVWYSIGTTSSDWIQVG